MYSPSDSIYYKDSMYYHIQNSSCDDTQLTINGKSFEKEKIDLVVLNLHSRTDMCYVFGPSPSAMERAESDPICVGCNESARILMQLLTAALL